jgi:hypothetical protein
MCWDIAVLLLVRGCSGTGRFAWQGSWATPARGRVCSLVSANFLVTQNAGAAGRATFPAVTSPESFIRYFAGQALLALI